MASGIKDRVAIIGMGCTKFGEHWDKGPDDLIVDAFEQALVDAGIARSGINAAQLAGACAAKHRLDRNDLKRAMAHVRWKSHRNAVESPLAHLRKAVAIETILKAAMIADPLGLFGCCGVSDGAACRDGARPCQVDGGRKCFGHPVGASGLRMAFEGYSQLLGRAGSRQRGAATLGLTHNLGGAPFKSVAAVSIFGRLH